MMSGCAPGLFSSSQFKLNKLLLEFLPAVRYQSEDPPRPLLHFVSFAETLSIMQERIVFKGIFPRKPLAYYPKKTEKGLKKV
jgi:hypothetical protein